MFDIFASEYSCDGHHYGEPVPKYEFRATHEYIVKYTGGVFGDEEMWLSASDLNGDVAAEAVSAKNILVIERKHVATCQHEGCVSEKTLWKAFKTIELDKEDHDE